MAARITLLVLVVLAAAVAAPALARDRPWLSKTRAQLATEAFVDRLCLGMDSCDDWDVAQPEDCRRLSLQAVTCDVALYDEHELVECSGTARARLTGRGRLGVALTGPLVCVPLEEDYPDEEPPEVEDP